ncbi:hypothetical protein CLOM_g1499 [Closterium sp. NIES-68]|nr:hypothetical protein CLOM_g1499 [Closterium sp. NIES-68]GJP59412.1 hypothetical protein CLOP_g11774 [Closterium sp. NIES-67]
MRTVSGQLQSCLPISSDFASAAPVNAPVQESPPPPASSSSLPAIIGGVVAGIACLLLLLIGVWWWWRRQQQQQRKMKGSIGLEKGEVADPLREEILGHLQQLQRFRLEDLRKATGGFGSRQLLGEGGYGLVYRGALEDGKQVAVKLLKKEKRGSEEAFVNEVNAISCAVHRNLLRLEGFCVDKGERLLVFPFLPHGSVADYLKGGRLRDKTTLTWKHRRNIVLGTAEGLAYMHTDCTPRLIHCDVKAENVLLTKDNDPVICDFGLSKLVEVEVPSIPKRGGAGAAVRGTLGHLAPEVYATGKWSEKSDVFGFGVLLVELIAGSSLFDLPMSQGEPQGEGTGGSGKDQRDQKESGEGGGRKGTDEQGGATEEIKDVGGEKEKQAKQEEVEEEEREKAGDDMTLREWVTCEMQQGHVNTLVDVQIRSHPADCDPLEVQVFLHVALLCLQQSPTDRPTMSECVTMLQGTGLACRWQLWGNGMEEGMRPPDMPTPDGVVSDSGDSYLPLDISGPR